MLLPSFKRNALAPERPQVASAWLILLLAGLVGSALWVLYPRHDLERRLQDTQGNIELTEAYLRNLLRSEPDNSQLQALLERIEQTKAQMQVEPLTPAQEAVQEAWNTWDASYALFQRTAPRDQTARDSARTASLQLLAQLPVADLTEAQLLYLGQAALVLRDQDQARRSFDQLLQRPGTRGEAADVLEIAAKSALGNGLYDTAARWFVEAAEGSQDTDRRKALLLAAVGVLQAGNLPAPALALGEERLAPYANDPLVLRKLIEVARAAGRPEAAQRYAKRLLQLSLLEQLQSSPQFAQFTPNLTAPTTPYWDDQPPPRAAGLRQTADRPGPQLPFDDKTYELGYTVFLEGRNLEDAWRVAKAAVQQAPDRLEWRRRLAQVSEWTRRPLEALAQWHAIALRTNEDAAWQQVLRLAPGLLDDRALADALQYQLRRTPHDARLIREMVATYERLGEPRKAIAFLQGLASDSPELGEALADLYERAGDDELALQQWERLFQQPGVMTPARAMKASVVALRLGQGHKGLAWLRATTAPTSTNPEEVAEYLRLKAEVADRQNAVPEAIAAYAALTRNETATVEDYDNYMELLRQQGHVAEAASVARLGWEKHQMPRHFTQALTLYADRQDWAAATPLVQSLAHTPKDTLAQLQADPAFPSLLGNYYQGMQQPDKARAAYVAGLRDFPQSPDLRQALLWLAIDSNDAVALQQLLQVHEAEWKQDPALHDALAASYQALSLPQVALSQYLQPRLEEHRGDFLWMMAYADALEQNQQADLAWRVRQQLLAREAAPRPGARGRMAPWLQEVREDANRRLARTRLVMTQRTGDAGAEALRELLRLDRQAGARPSEGATDALIGWYQDAGQYQAVRAHLWQRYAQSRSRNQPLWAEITAALAEDNRAEAGQLLERHEDVLPRYDRINAAVLVGDVRRAQSAAFDAQTQQPDDDPLHQQLADNLLAFSDSAGVQHASRRLNALSEQHTAAQFHWALTPRWSLDLEASRTQRSSRNATELVNPSNERGLDARLRWRDASSTAVLRAGRRESLDTYHPLQLQWEQRLDSRLRLRAELGTELPTEETTPLRMGGMKDRAGLGLSYNPTRMDTISLDHYQDRFHLQTGASIGRGQTTTLQYLHNLRSDAPSLELGGFWSHFRYRERNLQGLGGRDLAVLQYLPGVEDPTVPAGFLLPQNFSYYGLTIATNQRFSEEYTRALRPFASLSLTRHSREGAGYNLSLGFAGSVLGNDHLMLGLGFSKSSPQTSGSSRELQVSYRLHF